MKILKVISCMLLVVSLLTLIACKNKEEEEEWIPPREYDETEVLENATHLIHTAKKINTVLWGVGILSIDDDGSDHTYLPASSEEMEEYGIYSVEDIRKIMKRYYSAGVCDTVEKTILGNVRDENSSIVSLVRYYDDKDKETGDVTLMVNRKANVYFTNEVEYHTETMRIKEVKGEVIYLTVDVVVYDDENNAYERCLTFSVIEEDTGWKLHSPTYMKYDPYTDIYDNLTKQ